MADNRMFLVHRPTGMAVLLAKKLGSDFFGCASSQSITTLDERMATLFREVERQWKGEWSQDDFVVAFESDEGFSYGESIGNGLRKVFLSGEAINA